MISGPEAERRWGFRAPTRGPLRWLFFYLGAVAFAGTLYHVTLGFISPRAPDATSGRVYEVPARGADYFVGETEAYLLRAFAAHLAVLVAWTLLIVLTREGERLQDKADKA